MNVFMAFIDFMAFIGGPGGEPASSSSAAAGRLTGEPDENQVSRFMIMFAAELSSAFERLVLYMCLYNYTTKKKKRVKVWHTLFYTKNHDIIMINHNNYDF